MMVKNTPDDASPTMQRSNVCDFTMYRLQKLIDEAEEAEELLTYAEILFGYEAGDWEVEWIGGKPFPVGSDIEFWDKDLRPLIK
mgnify:CR=1 FL=1